MPVHPHTPYATYSDTTGSYYTLTSPVDLSDAAPLRFRERMALRLACWIIHRFVRRYP